MGKLLNFFLLLSLGLLFSCSLVVDYKIPAHRFMDPETRGTSLFSGEFGGFAQVSVQSSHDVRLGEVFDGATFGARDGKELSRESSIGFQGGLGIIPTLDIIYRDNDDSPGMIVAKYQFIGNGYRQLDEGLKASTWFGIGSMKEERTPLTINFGNTHRSYKADMKVKPWELGASVGYRFNPISLLYVNAVYARYETDALLRETNQPDVKITGASVLEALTLGHKLSMGSFGLHLEAGVSRVEWSKDDAIKQNMGTIGSALSFEF